MRRSKAKDKEEERRLKRRKPRGDVKKVRRVKEERRERDGAEMNSIRIRLN